MRHRGLLTTWDLGRMAQSHANEHVRMSLVVKMLSLVETAIDFSDEEEIENISYLLRIDLQKLENIF